MVTLVSAPKFSATSIPDRRRPFFFYQLFERPFDKCTKFSLRHSATLLRRAEGGEGRGREEERKGEEEKGEGGGEEGEGARRSHFHQPHVKVGEYDLFSTGNEPSLCK